MKLPVLWLACAFAAGIALALASPHALPAAAWTAAAVLMMLAGAAMAWRGIVVAAWSCALATWLALGGTAVALERASVPANHVTRLIAAGRLDMSEPLRWRGRLRENPLALPWGYRYEIDLEEVEARGARLRVSGGLRADLYNNGAHSDGGPSGLLAGDRVEALLLARPPRNFLNRGAFDLRRYLAQQKIDLTGSLRNGELLRLLDRPRPTMPQRMARIRSELLARIDALFSNRERAAVLRAMLLGDRSFVESETVTAFQKTSAYHILVVAGLHVGALVAFLFWACRRLRLRVGAASFSALAVLAAYVSVVQDRPPILRAALMATFYLAGRPLFRRVDLLNTVAAAALVLLVWKPSSLNDASFQLSFAAAGIIAAVAVPWIDRTSAPYNAAVHHLGDVTRDGGFAPKVARFRLDLRDAVDWLSAASPKWLALRVQMLVTLLIRCVLRLWEIVLLSVLIQWGMLPLLAADFHRVSLQGPVSNIPAVILTGFIVPLGFLAVAASFTWSKPAMFLAKGVGICAGLLLESVGWFSRLPHASYRIPGPPMWLAIAFVAALLALVHGTRAPTQSRRARRAAQPPFAIHRVALARLAAVALVAFSVLVATYPFAPSLSRGKLEANVLDVGQGDSSFVAFPDGHTLLIDGGGLAGAERVHGYRSGFDVGEQVVSSYLWSRGIKTIDAVMLTHGDHDHLDGLHSVIDNFKVGELWIGRQERRSPFDNLVTEARVRGVRVVYKNRGDRFDWGGATGEFLWPADSAPRAKPSNDDSLVLRITEGSNRFLFTGDIQERAEREMTAGGEALESDFLKVPHHGSKTSSTERFLAAVVPRLAVISVGQANPFGQPSALVVERYEQQGVRLLRTDRDGEVTARTDGARIEVSTFTNGNLSELQTPSFSRR